MGDAGDFVERQSRVEMVSEEILEAKEQITSFDRRRNTNREALGAFRRNEIRPGKMWFSVDNLFIKMPQADGKRLIENDQKVLTDEIEKLRETMREKTMELQKYEGTHVSSLGLKPMTKIDTEMPETKPTRRR
eukprot:CFRG3581T1